MWVCHFEAAHPHLAVSRDCPLTLLDVTTTGVIAYNCLKRL